MLLATAFIVGCKQSDEVVIQQDKEEVKDITVEQVQKEPPGPFPVTVTDGSGQAVTIEKEPQTVVSLLPNNTEIVFALGVGEKLIGVSEQCDYPAEASKIEKVGSMEMNVDKILKLKPDLVLLSPYQLDQQKEGIDKLKKAAIQVVIVGVSSSFADVYQSIDLIAQVTGAKEQGEQLVKNMQDQVASIQEKAAQIKDKKKVWVEVIPEPEIYTAGSGTLIHEMLQTIQATNVVENQEGWVKYEQDQIKQLNPEMIITTYGYYIEEPIKGVLQREGWEEVPAVKNKQVFNVENDLVSRPGPRLIDGLETLASIVYPEVFPQEEKEEK